MSGVYVYSTLSADTSYPTWHKSGGDQMVKGPDIIIKGGANVADKNLVTPRGCVTTLTDEQFAQVEANSVFKRHLERGYVSVDKRRVDPEAAAADMTTRDVSAPLIAEDFDPDKEPLVSGKRKYTRRG